MNKFKSIKLKSPIAIIIVWLVISLLIILLHKYSLFEQLENNSLDFRFKHFTIEERADSNIVLVAIDDQSLEFANQNGTFWPWPREFYAFATNYLTDCGAKQVIFDIQFNEADYNRGDLDSAESDLSFAKSIESNGKVILSAQALLDTKQSSLQDAISGIQVVNNSSAYPSPYHSLSIPIEEFRSKASGVGLINITPDNDGVVRRVPLLSKLDSLYYPQISYIAWLKQVGIEQTVYHSDFLQAGDSQIPLINGYNYLINWYGKGDVDGVFNYIPFSALVQSAAATAYNQEPVFTKSYFKGKTIFIGATAPGLLDLKTSPTNKIVPGMEIWATILSNLKNSDFITIASSHYIYLLISILVLLIMLMFCCKKTLYAHLGLVLII